MPVSLNRITPRNRTRLAGLDSANQQAALIAADFLALEARHGLGVNGALEVLWSISALVAAADKPGRADFDAVRSGALARNGGAEDSENEESE